MDDEKILFDHHTVCQHDSGTVEVLHIRAAEYFSTGRGTAMVGIRITRGDGDKVYVDVTKNHYDEHGLEKIATRALKAREEKP